MDIFSTLTSNKAKTNFTDTWNKLLYNAVNKNLGSVADREAGDRKI